MMLKNICEQTGRYIATLDIKIDNKTLADVAKPSTPEQEEFFHNPKFMPLLYPIFLIASKASAASFEGGEFFNSIAMGPLE